KNESNHATVVDLNRIALHQLLRPLELFVVRAFWWTMFVIPFDVLAMVARAPSARIAAEPGTVGVQGAVVPVVPGVHGKSMTFESEGRKKIEPGPRGRAAGFPA